MDAGDDHPFADMFLNDTSQDKVVNSGTKTTNEPSSRKQVDFHCKILNDSVYSLLERGRRKLRHQSTTCGHPTSKTVKQYIRI